MCSTINAFLMGHPEFKSEDRDKLYEITEKVRVEDVKRKPRVPKVKRIHKVSPEMKGGYKFGDRESNPNAHAVILQLTGREPIWGD